ncbi:MAG TPA: 1-deoxy-D-xylulose-5-phosphate synthase, partial [Clostridia bacterium]|nr:1-deoxy-D-xylulose-5-phosphate synthase [Clostridia bacterium]
MKIPSTKQLKKMDIAELKELAEELRAQIISVVTANGGHLASNLGVVELVIAIHYVFDTPSDKLIFDVGHQCYAHKLLTGRADMFSKLRMANGISGFPKQAESEYDTFDTGHASTSLSLASGLMRARNLKGEDYNIISLVGDGAFMGGQTLEALNDLGTISGKHILLLNDNNMTISKSVGSLNLCDDVLSNLFNAYHIDFAGSVDGHNIEELINCFNKIKDENKQFAVHILTEKGKGYKDAENSPDKFHAVSHFSVNEASGEYATAFGDTLTEIAGENKSIVAVTAAMTESVGLRCFSNKYSDRLFNVGICEAHAVTMASGLAKGGMKPYVAIYSSFLQRGFDQILNDVCLSKKPVTFAIDHSGFVDGDGETHQGFYDISYLNLMPNMTIVAPKCTEELKNVVRWSADFAAPLAIRYPKTILNQFATNCNSADNLVNSQPEQIVLGKWSNTVPKENLVILTAGAFCFNIALEVKKLLAEKGIIVAVQNALFLKPLDENYLSRLNKKTVVTLEDNVALGGFGSSISLYLTKKCLNIKHLA